MKEAVAWNYRDVVDNDQYPQIRVRITDPDGQAENVWARDIGEGLVMLCNSPIFPKYRLFDVVRQTGGVARELIFRTFPILFRYCYQPAIEGVEPDSSLEERVAALEKVKRKGEDPDLEVRKKLGDAVVAAGGFPGFFLPGYAYAYLTPGVEPLAILQAVKGTEIPAGAWHTLDWDDEKLDEIQTEVKDPEEPEELQEPASAPETTSPPE